MDDSNNADAGCAREMPKYRREQVVWALRIKAVKVTDEGGAVVHFKERDYSPRSFAPDEVADLIPMAGSWLIIERDGRHTIMNNEQFTAIHTAFVE